MQLTNIITSLIRKAGFNSYVLLMLACVCMLAVACQKDINADYDVQSPTLTHITINIDPQALSTRAAESYQLHALTAMRVNIVISRDQKVLSIVTKSGCDCSGSHQTSFDIPLLAGQNYDISAWADFDTGRYTLPALGAAPEVCLSSTTVTGTDNSLDAYFGTTTATIAADETINIQLTRPFAMLNVNTTDWNGIETDKQPTTYSAIIQAPKSINLTTGEVSQTSYISISGDILTSAATADGSKALTFDYILAPTETTTMPDFTMTFSWTGGTYYYTLSRIPLRRNYQTNVTGKIIK